MINNKILLKEEYKQGYPLVNLKPDYFIIKKGYSFSAVSYHKPKGEETVGKAKIILVNEYGDLVEQNIVIEFAFSETQRILQALKPESFKLRPSALTIDHPGKISNVDVINTFEDVRVINVRPVKTRDKHIWELRLTVQFVGYENKYEVVYPINYHDLESVSSTGEVPALKMAEINNINPDNIVTFDEVPQLELEENFTKGSPPVIVSPDVITPRANIEINELEYIPPADLDSKRASFKVEFTNKKSKITTSKFIGIKFAKSIREATDQSMKTVTGFDIEYLPKERLHIPLTMETHDFDYKGPIKNLEIVDVRYNYESIEENERFISVKLIVELKSINYEIDKVIEFAYSKSNYLSGEFRTTTQESESIIIPKSLLNPEVFAAIKNGDSKVKKNFIANLKIAKDYPYSKILNISIVRFIPTSKIVVLGIKAIEKKGTDFIVHIFEKTQELEETLNEVLLEKLTPEDITIKQDALPVAPSGDIDTRLFNIPAYAQLEAIQYVKPDIEAKQMQIDLKIKSGRRSKLIKKLLTFSMSEVEYQDYLRYEWEKKYLLNIDPSDIKLNIDTTQESPEIITPEQVIDLPEGTTVAIKYKKPPRGKRTGRLMLTLTKGTAKLLLEQTIMFEKPTL